MAHSFVTSFEEEIDAFRAFAETFPESTVLLIDTYDTFTGAHKAVDVAKKMLSRGNKLRGVRLDSGDMATLSKEVRAIFNREGLEDTKIFASGGFDEFKITSALERGAEIDAFGIGTKMGVSADAPYLDIAYKLVQYAGRPVLKLSTGKRTLVGEKQVFRIRRGDSLSKDIIALRAEKLEGTPLLQMVIKDGRTKQPPEPLTAIRDRCQKEFETLDEGYKALDKPRSFPVELAPGLEELQRRVAHEVRGKELGES